MFRRAKAATDSTGAAACIVEGCEALAVHTWREAWHIPQDDGAGDPVQLVFLLPFCEAHYAVYVKRFTGQAQHWDMIPHGALETSARQLAIQVREIITARDGDPFDVGDILDALDALDVGADPGAP